MIEYRYWAHRQSGDIYAVEIINGQVMSACGPLYYKDRPEDIRDFEYDWETGYWIWDNRGEFRLEEVS